MPISRLTQACSSLLAGVALLACGATMANAAPSCAEGPQTVGGVIVGTPCDDTIHAPRGISAVYGEGGNDSLYGGRGNDSLYGGEGGDRLYGGIGDDHVRGGAGDDLLSGGFGADSVDGEAGSDFVRGDATIDKIFDSGPAGDTDTLSYATGATPGFPNSGDLGYSGFPSGAAGRGVYVDLTQGFANNGLAPAGGGVDLELEGADFERLIGTPFADLLVGTADGEAIYGGGGADVILGEGGADQLYGGAEGDSCSGAPAASVQCETSGSTVQPRDPGAIAVGLMAPAGIGPPALYLGGSSGDDEVSAVYSQGSVTFELGAGSVGGFDPAQAVQGECTLPSSEKAVCPVAAAPDSIVVAGLAGGDSLSTSGFPESTSVILLGGDGGDALTSGATEDAVVDGPGDDVSSAGAGDDALPNNSGADHLHAGAGDDLFVSNAVCEGDLLDAGEGVDNANWANFGSAVSLDLGNGLAGLVGASGQPACASGAPTSLSALEDLEGSNLDDVLVGDAGSNQLLGRPGHDSYFAAAGNDSILANSGDSDTAIDCGEGFDTAQIDIPTHTATEDFQDPAPVGCEAIHESAPNSFRPPDTPPGPEEEPPPVPPPPPGQSFLQASSDTTPPRTYALHRPPRTLFIAGRRRTVAFAFASSEAGSSFRCRLDRAPFRPCRSPRRYRLTIGAHVVRIFAVDAAGNRDRSPLVLRLRLRRR
jgi:Ca2+-binding RTX toxin-like protein